VLTGVIASWLCAFALATLTPATASAASASFCGVLVPSSNAWVETGKYCASGAITQWNYVSNTYPGGGNITRMRAGLWSTTTGNQVGGHRWADNATFVSSCAYGLFTNSFGVINQYESSGASHTLNGHVDNSPNHTNCFSIV
jgi:hypothetical protein